MHQSYAHGVASRPLLGQTLGQALDTAACRFGARDAVISLHQNLRYSYAELLHEVNRAAKGLIALGVQRGDRVGIWSPNNAEWAITQDAVAARRAIWLTSIRHIGSGNCRWAEAVRRQCAHQRSEFPKRGLLGIRWTNWPRPCLLCDMWSFSEIRTCQAA